MMFYVACPVLPRDSVRLLPARHGYRYVLQCFRVLYVMPRLAACCPVCFSARTYDLQLNTFFFQRLSKYRTDMLTQTDLRVKVNFGTCLLARFTRSVGIISRGLFSIRGCLCRSDHLTRKRYSYWRPLVFFPERVSLQHR